jgi:hypothetical protein
MAIKDSLDINGIDCEEIGRDLENLQNLKKHIDQLKKIYDFLKQDYSFLQEEMRNYRQLSAMFQAPTGFVPELEGFEISGESIPFYFLCEDHSRNECDIKQVGKPVGGDHITFMDFTRRFDLEKRIESVEKDIDGLVSGVSSTAEQYVEKLYGNKEMRSIFADRFKSTDERVIKEHLRRIHKHAFIKTVLSNDLMLKQQADIRHQLVMNKERAGIAIMDVEGHSDTDGLLAAMLHQCLLLGAQYELLNKGQITEKLFEEINMRFFQSTGVDKSISLIYGEIHRSGVFRYILAGHPPPLVFSSEYNRFQDIGRQKSEGLLGQMPLESHTDMQKYLHLRRLGFKEPYQVNEIKLMAPGDIILMYSDGLSAFRKADGEFFSEKELEGKLAELKHLPAKEISAGIKDELFRHKQTDDLTYIVIKYLK